MAAVDEGTRIRQDPGPNESMQDRSPEAKPLLGPTDRWGSTVAVPSSRNQRQNISRHHLRDSTGRRFPFASPIHDQDESEVCENATHIPVKSEFRRMSFARIRPTFSIRRQTDRGEVTSRAQRLRINRKIVEAIHADAIRSKALSKSKQPLSFFQHCFLLLSDTSHSKLLRYERPLCIGHHPLRTQAS